MANLHLICEGESDSIDQRLIDRLVVQHHGLPVQVRSARGDSGLRAIRKQFENPPRDRAISVEDRNYEPLARAQATWTAPNCHSFTWQRHEIENYLLAPVVVHELFEEYRRTVHAIWVQSLPPSVADVSALLRQLAVPWLPTHAANVLRLEVMQAMNAVGDVRFAPKKPSASDAAGWELSLEQEGRRLVKACEDTLALPNLAALQLRTRFAALLAQFQQPAFLDSGDFLRDMAGKELLGSLLSHLQQLGANRLSREDLEDGLIEAAARIYQPSTIYHPDEFAHLAAVLRAL